VDRACLLPALVVLTSIADATDRVQRAAIVVRVLSSDITPSEARTVAAVATTLGYGGCAIAAVPVPRLPIVHGRYITRATYLRFRLGSSVTGSPVMLYLDADVLVLGDLLAFLELAIGNALGLVRDQFNPSIGTGPALPGLAKRAPELVGLPYFNAGVCVARPETFGRAGAGSLAAMRREPGHIHFNDQDGLNLWAARSAEPVVELPERFNRFELGRFLEEGDWVRRVVAAPASTSDPVALHFVGPRKPWLRSCPDVEAVRVYRRELARTQRLVRRVGDMTLDVSRKGVA
jgi:lipopolysaccharide biosynthesis glycosyltransferase